MCGRFALSAVTVNFVRDFGVEKPQEMPLADRYNIAPTQPVLIVREDREGGSGRRELAHVVWGLIPSWAETPAMAARMINARAETAAEKPAFRSSMKRRRCLIPTTGFYEWRKAPNGELPPRIPSPAEGDTGDLFDGAEEKSSGRAPGGILRSSGAARRRVLAEAAGPGARGPRKVPFFIHMRDGHPFAFAGLWEAWTGPHGELLESCTILTTKANELVAPIHDRMPVILPPDAYDLWLDPAVQDAREVTPLLRPYEAAHMELYEVSTRVNSPANDAPDLIAPAHPPA